MSSAKDKAAERVRHALQSLELLQERLAGKTQNELAEDPVLIDACCYRISIVGEAIDMAKSYHPAVFAKVPVKDTTWDQLVEIRNMFVHEYVQISAQHIVLFLKGAENVRVALGRVLGQI